MLIIDEIKLQTNQDEEKLIELIKKRLHLHKESFNFRIKRKSLDARKSPSVYVYQVLLTIDNEQKYLNYKGVRLYKQADLKADILTSDERPIIIGYGPSGIFACYRLVEAGLKPIVIEKGKRIVEREKDVDFFFKTGILDENSNVQFGEGGAGTFSDAKLMTRNKDPFIEYILSIFVKFGASEEILYDPHSHIGTDVIRKIIVKITDHLISKGADFYFEEEFQEILLNDDHTVVGIKTNKQTIKGRYVLLGPGHSAYKTYEMLAAKGVELQAKDLAIGYRVEHPQKLIDKDQKPNEYFLTYRSPRNIYSFCMCPGGFVVPATSNYKRVVTNGMSYAKRDSGTSNSAILIQVPKELFDCDPFNGLEYIKKIEEQAYNISNSYKALASNISDYINNKKTEKLVIPSTYSLGTTLVDYNDFLSEEENKMFKEALKHFDKIIPGFIEQGIMVGPETRSSSPIRIPRDTSLNSTNTKGLYPMGEGAGYGGGIMSCSLDGIKVANKIIDNLK